MVSTELNTKQGEQNSVSKDYTAQNSKNTNSSNTVVSSNTGSTSQNLSSTQLPATYIKDGYYVHNGHKIAITSELTRGTYTFNDPSQSSVWKYQSCILYWCWRVEYQDWGLSFQCGPSTENECIEVAKKAFPVPNRVGNEGEIVSKKVWVYLNDGNILNGVPSY